MGKPLTIIEKLNAEAELEENIVRLEQLKEEKCHLIYGSEAFNDIKEKIKGLQNKKRQLENYIYRKAHNYSKYKGLFSMQGTMYKMYGKKKNELTPEELREYNRLKKRESRTRKRGLQPPNVNKEG